MEAPHHGSPITALSTDLLENIADKLSLADKCIFLSSCRQLRQLGNQSKRLWADLNVALASPQHARHFAAWLRRRAPQISSLTVSDEGGAEQPAQLLAFLCGALAGGPRCRLRSLEWECSGTLELGRWVEYLPTQLERLTLSATRLSVTAHAARLSALTGLWLLSEDVQADIPLQPGCLPPQLRDLCLNHAPPDPLHALAGCAPRLQQLALGSVEGAPAPPLALLTAFSQLTSLSLGYRLPRVPSQVASLTLLRELELHVIRESDDEGGAGGGADEGLAWLAPLTQLTRLALTWSHIHTPLPPEVLSLPELERLWLFGVPYLPPLVAPPVPAPLRHLGLEFTVALGSVPLLERLGGLEYLALSTERFAHDKSKAKFRARAPEEGVACLLRALLALPALREVVGLPEQAIAAAYPALAPLLQRMRPKLLGERRASQQLP